MFRKRVPLLLLWLWLLLMLMLLECVHAFGLQTSPDFVAISFAVLSLGSPLSTVSIQISAETVGFRPKKNSAPPKPASDSGSKNSGPRRAPAPAATAARYRCSERGQPVSGLTTRPSQHLVDDSGTSCRQAEIAGPVGAATRPHEAERARARACQGALARRAGESDEALCHVSRSLTAHYGVLMARVGR